MPPIFNGTSFEFAPGEVMPAHIDDYPDPEALKELDPSLSHILGIDSYSNGEQFPIALNIESSEEAERLRQAYLRKVGKPALIEVFVVGPKPKNSSGLSFSLCSRDVLTHDEQVALERDITHMRRHWGGAGIPNTPLD